MDRVFGLVESGLCSYLCDGQTVLLLVQGPVQCNLSHTAAGSVLLGLGLVLSLYYQFWLITSNRALILLMALRKSSFLISDISNTF